MKDIVISDAVKYIGADDKDLDLFESQYIVPNGVSYNSYVILDEKIAVMDTIDTRKTDEWKENLERVLDGRTPDYLVVSHLEPDHAGSIKEFADKYPETKIVASAKAIAMLPQFFEIADLADRAVAVKEGEELSLGSHTLQFFMALVSFVSFKFTCSCCFEALCSSSICFNFWHDVFLLNIDNLFLTFFS